MLVFPVVLAFGGVVSSCLFGFGRLSVGWSQRAPPHLTFPFLVFVCFLLLFFFGFAFVVVYVRLSCCWGVLVFSFLFCFAWILCLFVCCVLLLVLFVCVGVLYVVFISLLLCFWFVLVFCLCWSGFVCCRCCCCCRFVFFVLFVILCCFACLCLFLSVSFHNTISLQF